MKEGKGGKGGGKDEGLPRREERRGKLKEKEVEKKEKEELSIGERKVK